MVSIIVSTVNPERLVRFRKNIEETICGCEYEIIAIENNVSPRPLTAVYNEGAERAKFPYLLFMHEDAGFISRDWWPVIEEKLSEQDCGVIGFTGSKIMFDVPSGWCIDSRWMLMNVIECGTKFKVTIDDEKAFEETVSLDGVSMFVRKEVWREVRFDTALLSGFHCYDVDFSLCVAKKYKNYVCTCVDIYHDSPGHFDNAWMSETMKMYENKWRHFLPMTSSDISFPAAVIKKWEERAYFKFVRKLNRDGVSTAGHMRYFLKYPCTFRHMKDTVRLALMMAKSKLWKNK